MSTRIGGSRIPWVIRSFSLTDSTISSATSRPKRRRDLLHRDDNSNHPRLRSPCMRVTAYHRLIAHGANSHGVARQTDRVCSVLELPVRIHGSAAHMLRSFISNPENQRMREATVLDKTNEEVYVSLFCDICTLIRVFPSLRSTFEG
ncbi:hypothetical protein PIB30_023877 [Stylosanthes scabra]|uniref:Uncharacterized protein n=1 Tax=Stylosanthes scabra TaxID=79078 RepID=A0ABU6TAB2_9FABA|nr:hypothetical protein [Stylosanthes scabra]